MDGTPVDGFPLTVNDYVRGTPAVTDLDSDGDVEIVLAGWDLTLYVWDLNATWNPLAAPWPTYAHDMQRTGSRSTLLPTDATEQAAVVPSRFAVHANVPNPFNPATTIRFDLPQTQNVTVDIHDVRGRRVVRLLQEVRPAGTHEVIWNGRDTAGRAVASGLYWVRVHTSHDVASRKMVLLR